jgi:hypothetical protein
MVEHPTVLLQTKIVYEIFPYHFHSNQAEA